MFCLFNIILKKLNLAFRSRKTWLSDRCRILVEPEDWFALPDLCDGGMSAATAGIIQAGIAAASTTTQGIFANVKKRGSTRMMEVAKELAKYNTQLSEEMYNKYQSPQAMMAAYKAAGLNPNLIYDSAGSGGTPQAGQVNTDPSAYADERKPTLGAIAEGILRYQQVRSNQIQNSNGELVGQLTGAQIEMEKERTRGLMYDNFVKNATKDYQVESMALDVANKTFRNAYKNIVDLQNAIKDLDVKEASIQHSNASTDKINEETKNVRVQRKVLKSQLKINEQTLKNMELAYDFDKEANPYRLKGLKLGNSISGLRYQMLSDQKELTDADNAGYLGYDVNPGSKFYKGYTNMRYQGEARKLDLKAKEKRAYDDSNEDISLLLKYLRKL